MLNKPGAGYLVTPRRESSGHCDCCGKASRTIWGDVSWGEAIAAVYYIHWTIGALEHFPIMDLIIGPWGDDVSADDRALVCLSIRPNSQGGGAMAIDAGPRLDRLKTLCAHAMTRDDIVGAPISRIVFGLFDAIWLQDQRLFEGEVFETGG